MWPRLRVASLRLQKINVGRYSNTRVVIAYIEGVANPDIVAQIRESVQGTNVAPLKDGPPDIKLFGAES